MAKYLVEVTYSYEVKADDTYCAMLLAEYDGKRIKRRTIVKDIHSHEGLKEETVEWK